MVTIGYAKYMDSDTYLRYLNAENSCRTIGLPITQWLAHYFGLELDEALDTVQRAVDYHGGAEALAA